MIAWIESTSGWDRTLPVTLIATGLSAPERHALPHALLARALEVPPNAVAIERAEGRPPVISQPAGSGLCLSTASRGSFAAVALARSPVGVDVEVAASGDVPWNVLHPSEIALLESVQWQARASAFARIWSLKEAYVKALGSGLFREPSSFAVALVDEGSATVHDLSDTARVMEAKTTWRAAGRASAAISAVILEPRRI